MRIDASVTSISWIPSEAITGPLRLPFDIGVGHYDDPPPDNLDDVASFVANDRCRFANDLRAWIEVDGDGRILDADYAGTGYVGSTTLQVLGRSVTFPGVGYPVIQEEPQRSADRVRFVQTAGGRTGTPSPRPVRRAPFVRIVPPTVWTTLALTLHADGRVEHEVVSTSPFPRHWIYDGDATLVAKSGFMDFQTWSETNIGDETPWGELSPTDARITEVESALERQLSLAIMRSGEKPELRKVDEGALLTRQGDPGDELYLLLDGIVRAEVDDEPLAELGPGSIVGERSVLEGGLRTATLRAVTPLRVAVARANQLDPAELSSLAEGHRREEQRESHRPGNEGRGPRIFPSGVR